MANGGGTEGRTDGRMDVWKFPPVFYRTSALWGRCPKRDRKGGKKSEKSGEKRKKEKRTKRRVDAE